MKRGGGGKRSRDEQADFVGGKHFCSGSNVIKTCPD